MPLPYNVLFISPYSSTYQQEAGGGEASLLGLLEGLDRELFNPIVVYPLGGFSQRQDRNLTYGEFFRERDIELHFLPMSLLVRNPLLAARLSWNFPALLRHLRELIQERRIDLVHTNSAQVIAGGIAARLSGVPSIYHVRFLIAQPRLYRRIVAKLTDRLADRIIVISRAVGQMFWENGVAPEKAVLVYNGVDINRFAEAQPAKEILTQLGLLPGTPLVGAVGRLHPVKGLEYLIEAAPQVLQQFPLARFLIMGDVESERYLPYKRFLQRRVRELGLVGKVIFLGRRRDVPQLMKCLHLFVLPSASPHSPEPLGRVVIEAMAAGRPVVATRDGGVVEIVAEGETGLLVPPRDAPALARSIITLLKDPARRHAMGQAGSKRAAALFSLHQYAAAIQQTYLNVLESRRREAQEV